MKLASKMYGLVRSENTQLPLSYGHACQKHKHFESWMAIVTLAY